MLLVHCSLRSFYILKIWEVYDSKQERTPLNSHIIAIAKSLRKLIFTE
jgi:hypothetical protein